MWFDVAAALAEIEGHPPATSATPATNRANVAEVASVAGGQARNREAADRAAPDLARDLFEERAAIREHHGGLDRAEAEALALEDSARALGLPVHEVRAAVMPEAPALDAEGLPCQPCTRCGAGDYWKPAHLPFEGEGWRCVTCQPPDRNEWRHAVSVPSGLPEAI